MADDSTCATSPSILQDGSSGNVSPGIGNHIQFHWFTCGGEGSQRDMRLHPDGFVMNGEMNVAANCTSVWRRLRNPLVLFGRNFDLDSALLFQSKLLFQIARKDFLLLDSASKLNSHLPTNISTSMQSDVDYYMQLRKHICELMAYTRCYVARVIADENSAWLLDNLIQSLSGNLFSLRLLLRSLKDLPDYIVAHSANSHGNKCPQASYHLFHAHLDLRWYHLTVLHQLVKSQSLYITLDDSQPNSEEHKRVDRNMLEEHILLLLSDLIVIAISKFERMPLSSTLKKTPFSCTCVRELWLMLQLYVERIHEAEHGKSFWTYLNQILGVVLGKKSVDDTSVHNCSALRVPEAYTCTDRFSFSLWLLVHIAQLNGYTEEGQYVGTGSGRVKSNYLQLEAVLKACMSADSSVAEKQLRVIIRLVMTLITEWWEPRSEPIMILWEYYHRRLNSAFFVPGAAPDTMAVMSKTGAGLLQQVKSRLNVSEAPQDEDSFSLFLCLLGKHLNSCLNQSHQRHWQQMKGRIYSKFSPNKLLALTEMGLYHFVSLFLTLAITVDLQEVGRKLQDLLSLLPIDSLDLNRQHVHLKANFALMQLYVERGLDIADISLPMQSIGMEFCTHKSGNVMILMRTFVEGVQDIVNSSHSLKFSEHSLIGGWVTHYLSKSSVSDSCRLLDTVISIVTKLRQIMNSVMDEDSGDCSQPKKMVEVLMQHILPYVQSQCSGTVTQPPFQVADLAANFTLLALEQPHFQTQSFDQLFFYFLSSEKMNITLVKRYLNLVLLEETVMRNVIDPSKDYESIIIQAWFRCSVLSVNKPSEEMLDLTRTMDRLPEVQDLCQTSAICLADADDPLFTFVKLVGLRYKSLQDIHRKSLFHKKCLVYFMQFDKCVSSVINCATSSSELVSRIYACAVYLLCHCGQIVYTKSTPNCLLPQIVNLLLLPHAIYRPETQLHPFIASAIKKTLHQFIFGIVKLNPKQDDFLARILRDIVTYYLPRMVTKTANGVNVQGAFTSHPLLKCFVECENPEVWRLVLESLSKRFFTYKRTVPHEHAVLALGFLLDVITLKKFSADLMNQIIKHTVSKIFELAMSAEDGHIARQQAVGFIRTVTNSDVFKENVDMRESFLCIFMMFCQEHLAFSSARLFRLSTCLAELCPELMITCLPQLKDLIKSVELRRGVGYDPGLSGKTSWLAGQMLQPLESINMCLLWFMVLLFVESAVKDTDGQLIGLWHPVTNFASVRLVQCPQTRGQFWSCVPVAFCGTLLPRSSRRYCRWDGTEPSVCCPQQPTSQPLIHKRCGILYSADREGPYIPHDQILGAAVGGIPLRTATSSPWMVAVGERQENGSVDWYCGGALLQADTVLTAAHCCIRRSPDVVRVGELDFSRPDEKDASPEDITVDRVDIHPNYTPPKYYNDIAILKLSHQAEYSRYVRPVCLPEPGQQTVAYEGTSAVLTGWGYLSFGGERSPILQEVSVTIFNNSDCRRAYSSPLVPRRNYPEGIINSQLCAGDPNGGKDACQGDSGGPLVVQEGGVHILVGVVSSGIGCGSKAFPGVYSRVSAYIDWIKSHLR